MVSGGRFDCKSENKMTVCCIKWNIGLKLIFNNSFRRECRNLLCSRNQDRRSPDPFQAVVAAGRGCRVTWHPWTGLPPQPPLRPCSNPWSSPHWKRKERFTNCVPPTILVYKGRPFFSDSRYESQNCFFSQGYFTQKLDFSPKLKVSEIMFS